MEKNGASNDHNSSYFNANNVNGSNGTTDAELAKKSGYVNRMRKVRGLGIFFAVMYAFFMSTAVAIVKFIKGIHPIEILVMSTRIISQFERSIMQLVVFGILAIRKGTPLLGHPNERWHILGRAVSGAVNQGSWYFSVRLISLMDSSAIFYSAPVFVGLLAFIFLKEPFGIFEGVSVIMTLCGVLLISRPKFIPFFADGTPMTVQAIEGLLLAVLGSFTFALSNIHIRKLQKSSTEVVAVWFSLLTIIIGIVLVLIVDKFRSPSDLTQLVYILIVGFFGIMGQISFSLALKIEKAGPVSIAQSCNIIIVVIYQLAFFHEPVSTLSLIGAGLIGSSVVLTGLKDILLNNQVVDSIKETMTGTVSWNLDHNSNGSTTSAQAIDKYNSFSVIELHSHSDTTNANSISKDSI